MRNLFFATAMLLSACGCGDNKADPDYDEYVKCEQYCKPGFIKEFDKVDGAYICTCFEQPKD
jgi:hypothetical protein